MTVQTNHGRASLRCAIDTGGTFTDLVVEDVSGDLLVFKAPTTPKDPLDGALAALEIAARAHGSDLTAFLGRVSMLLYGTTRATNAIVTDSAARTAFLTTQGHPDILLLREGGRTDPFDLSREYPAPYVPRALTFEIPERIVSTGEIVRPLDETAVRAVAARLRELEVEAVAVCLLWSIVNGRHEERTAEILREELGDIPLSLSHQLNPVVREYRRASSTCIDASLKPLMTGHLLALERRLADAGFRGRVLVASSTGGVMDARAIARSPIHTLGSGPAMAPVAGRHFGREVAGSETAIVADTGGTTYDVSLVRDGNIPLTGEHWVGAQFYGHMTGIGAVDVNSIGAGGGSIAYVDEGGLLHVGPASAGAVPGPACYGRGGTEPTVTDASVVLGAIDPDNFLGGAMRLNAAAAQEALERHVAEPLGMNVKDAAAAVLELATEHMVHAIEDITVSQGLDPEGAALVAGGGAAGLNAVAIARRLRCSRVVVPYRGAALSAVGALLSDLAADFRSVVFTRTDRWEYDHVNDVLDGLTERCEAFIRAAGVDGRLSLIEIVADAHYRQQVWDIEVPVRTRSFSSPADVAAFVEDFHAVHDRLFAVSDPGSPIELVGFRARATCRLPSRVDQSSHARPGAAGDEPQVRSVHFAGHGLRDAVVKDFSALDPGESFTGPAIVESPFTTLVVDPGAHVVRADGGDLLITLGAG
jgi:N-methylhydantoinase A